MYVLTAENKRDLALKINNLLVEEYNCENLDCIAYDAEGCLKVLKQDGEIKKISAHPGERVDALFDYIDNCGTQNLEDMDFVLWDVDATIEYIDQYYVRINENEEGEYIADFANDLLF